MAFSVLFSNVGQFIVNFSFLPLVDSIGDSGTFLFFFFVSIAGVSYVLLFTVETKEKEPPAILAELVDKSLSSMRGSCVK